MSPAFFPLSACPSGDSNETVHERISISPDPTTLQVETTPFSSSIFTVDQYLISVVATCSMISTSCNICSISEILASMSSFSPIDVSYSAFSEISPCAIASFSLSRTEGSFLLLRFSRSCCNFKSHSLVK